MGTDALTKLMSTRRSQIVRGEGYTRAKRDYYVVSDSFRWLPLEAKARTRSPSHSPHSVVELHFQHDHSDLVLRDNKRALAVTPTYS